MSLNTFLAKYDVTNWKTNELEQQLPQATSDIRNNPSDYSYIAKLILGNPVLDGRHRLVWLVLAPYAVNVLKLNKEDASELIVDYMIECNEMKPTTAGDTVDYYVSRAIINGLMPPKLETLKKNDSELYQIISEALNSPT
jgi:hypothetical protein